MTLSSIVKTVRVWGLRGILDYLHRLPVLWRLAHSDRHGYETPERGITLIGPFSISSGNAHTMRNIAHLLSLARIPHQCFDTAVTPTLPKSDYAALVTPFSAFDLSRYDHVVELFSRHAPQASNRVHAILMFWEFETGFAYAFPEVRSGAPLVAMSDFNLNSFREAAPARTPIFKIRHPLILKENDSTTPPAEIRRRYGIPPDAFMAFFNFDYGSSYYRKNPEAVVRAFAQAFPRGDESAVLVLKTSQPREPYAGYLKKAIAALSLAKRVILIERAISQPDMTGLIAACDCYVSLHRGEGFGIGMAEAMSRGKPVIATNYSANTEFCLPDCSFPIPCKTVPVPSDQRDIAAYAKVTCWAEPDADAAAAVLRRLYDNPALRAEIGAKARRFISDYFSVSNFKADVERFLNGR